MTQKKFAFKEYFHIYNWQDNLENYATFPQ